MPLHRALLLLATAAALLPLAACAPDLGAAPKPRAAASLAATQSLPDQGGAWPGDGWWRRYGDAQLDALIAEGLSGAPDVAAAAARIVRAEGVVRSRGADRGPTAALEGTAGYVKQSYNNGFPREFLPQGWNETGTLNARFGLDLDLWGRNRAALRAAVADADAARIEGAEARLTLATAIAAAYADLARLYLERDVAEQAVRIQRDSAQLVANRVQIGLDTEGQRKQAAAAVPASLADLGVIDESIALVRNQLAALIGAGPDRGRAIARPTMVLAGPTALPSAASLDLVGRRPDIAAARARAEAAAERIKVAKAAFYPDISLSGLVGLQALGFDNVFKRGSTYGNVGPAVSLPLFDGGRRNDADLTARAFSLDVALVRALGGGFALSPAGA